MPQKRRPNRRRVVRRNTRRRAGSSQRFANRRNIIRVALKANPTSKDLYYIPLTDLVPVSEPLPETDEQLHKINCNVTIVTNNNVTGCSFQMGIAGTWVFDENVESNDFLPLTTPKMLKSNRGTSCVIGIPVPTRYLKGVLTAGNSLAIKVYPVCDGQVNSATLLISTNAIFKLAIKEPQPVDVGVLSDLQSMLITDVTPKPPTDQVPLQISSTRGLFTTVDRVFPLTYLENNDNRRGYTVQGTGVPFFTGVLIDPGSSAASLQSEFDKAGYVGNIAAFGF